MKSVRLAVVAKLFAATPSGIELLAPLDAMAQATAQDSLVDARFACGTACFTDEAMFHLAYTQGHT